MEREGSIRLLYDGKCPLCLREVAFLNRKDNGRSLVQFVDITSPKYDPKAHGDVSFKQGMARIHAVLPDNKAVIGVEAFRLVYTRLGMGWLYSFTTIPILKRVAERIYNFWADRRTQLTTGKTLQQAIEQHEKLLKNFEVCSITSSQSSGSDRARERPIRKQRP